MNKEMKEIKKALNKELESLLTDKNQIPSKSIDKITDKIYLGDVEGTEDLNYFSKEKITHVLSLNDLDPKYITISFPESSNIIHKMVPISDEENFNLFKYLKECIEFIENSNKIYIHCMCGISRSPSIIIAYLMWKTHCNYYDAYFFVKNRRNFISPNDGFIKQLLLFEKILKENNYDLNKIDFNKINLINE